MFGYHFKIFIKNLVKNQLLTIVNLTGLITGFVIAMLVWSFVTHELSYDRFFKTSERVFRIIRNWQGSEKFSSDVPAPLAQSIYSEFPEVLAATRLFSSSNNIILIGDEVYSEKLVLVVDSSFFDVFGIMLIAGNKDQSLSNPGVVVLSRSTAEKLYPNINPMGQHLTIESSDLGTDGSIYTVTGVFADFPENSHMRPDFLISSTSFRFINNTSHFNHFLQTYILLKNPDQKDKIEAMLPEFLEQFYGSNYYNYSRSTYLLQSIQDIHLNTKVYPAGYETPRGSYFTIYFFPVLVVLILLISNINFVNLHTSQSLSRRKEVVIKKMFGASTSKELIYFIFDAVFIFLVALVLSVCIVELVFPWFQQLVERVLDRTIPYSPGHILTGIAIVIIMGLLAGLYPAVVLVSNNTTRDLEAWKDFKTIGVFFNSKLIIIQFALCIFFLTGSIFVYKQFRYMEQMTGKGFNKENILLIKNPWYLDSSHDAFKQTLRTHSSIMQISSSESVPGIDNFSVWGHPVDSAMEDCHITVIYCDYEYLDVLGMKLKHGRFFDRSYSTDHLGMVMNETAIKRLGWTEPIGKRYELERIYTVIGVVEDIHYESLHNTIEPMGMVLIAPGSESFISVRIEQGKTKEVISFIEDTWELFVPYRPMEYSFMDSEFDAWYKTDRKIGLITSLLSILAIVVSCLGLMGLMAYTVLRRIKEIGIRKVHGATSRDIHLLFMRDSNRCLFVALVIAIPAAYFALRKWLQGFAYKTDISWWVFILAGVIVYIIALLTILWQSQKAANQSTVNSLRYE